MHGLRGQFDRREAARREGVTITLWEYCRAGIPVTILTLALGVTWLALVQY